MLANKHRTGGPGHMSGVTAPELCACARGLQVTGAAAGGPRHAVAELFLSWVRARARCALCTVQCTAGEGFAPASGPQPHHQQGKHFQPVPGACVIMGWVPAPWRRLLRDLLATSFFFFERSPAGDYDLREKCISSPRSGYRKRRRTDG